MPIVVLYIAVSIDGFITKPDGDSSVIDSFGKIDYGFGEFFKSVDTIITGRIAFTSGKKPEPRYRGKKIIVLTNRSLSEEGIIFTSIAPKRIIEEFCSDSKKIWLAGGGKVATAFLNAGLIDEIKLLIVPVCLGKGIRLFHDGLKETHFQLRQSMQFENGTVMVDFLKR